MDIVKSLEHVKDEDVPRMLFLSVDPTRVNEDDRKVDLTPTSKDGDSGGFVTTKEIVNDDESDAAGRLLKKFKMALQEKSINPVYQELQVRLSMLSSLQQRYSCEGLSTLESNVSAGEDQLSTDEEDVLKFTEILELFNYSVPSVIKKSFDVIVRNKRIKVRESKESKKKTFFVHPENKVLMEMCSCLSAYDVYAMYEIIRDMKEDERDDANNLPHVPLEVLQNVAGLKDVAFFYLILSLMRSNMMNCLYTHKLNFLLEKLQKIHMERRDHSHIDRALASLRRYPVASHPPGLCLIFIMMEGRPGAEEDLKSVKNLFENVFMYDVIVKKDPTADEIKSVISDLEAVRNKFYDSLVVWFMSHGNESHLVVKDGKIHRREELIQPVANIKWFNTKPKLFFIQACANKSRKIFPPFFKYVFVSLILLLLYYFPYLTAFLAFLALVMLVFCPHYLKVLREKYEASVADTDYIGGWKAAAGKLWQEKYADKINLSHVNSFADTLISYATMWYQPAVRFDKGSLYVDTLVDQLEQYGSKESIESVLRRVNYNVNTVSLQDNVPGQGEVLWKQAPYFESSLQKEFVFPKTTDQ